MSFSKNDLKWLKKRNAQYINGAYYFDLPPMKVKVCDWEGFGNPGENFLCQIDTESTTMYAESYGRYMMHAIRAAVGHFMLQASIVAPLAKLHSVDEALTGDKP